MPCSARRASCPFVNFEGVGAGMLVDLPKLKRSAKGGPDRWTAEPDIQRYDMDLMDPTASTAQPPGLATPTPGRLGQVRRWEGPIEQVATGGCVLPAGLRDGG
jgi:hypothetical protein